MNQLFSSSALQLFSSQVGLLIMLVSSGCSGPVAVGQPTATVDNRADRKSWDAGVVLSDLPGYTCLSLEQVGLTAGDEIVSLSASCECLAPRVIKFQTTDSTTGTAVLLEYVVDQSSDPTQQSKSPAAQLGVVIAATLRDGRQHEFTVNLLHSHALDEEKP